MTLTRYQPTRAIELWSKDGPGKIIAEEDVLYLAADVAQRDEGIRFEVEQMIHDLNESLTGQRTDSSWIRPMTLGIKERQQLFADVQERAQRLLAHLEGVAR